jgi:hypothetical protein
MAIPIPETHRELLVKAVHGVFSTMMPDGQPQSSIVWVDYDGTFVLINTTLERKPMPTYSRSATPANSASMATCTLSNKSRRKRVSLSPSSRSKYRWMRFSSRERATRSI